jgi:hypothetical protein
MDTQLKAYTWPISVRPSVCLRHFGLSVYAFCPTWRGGIFRGVFFMQSLSKNSLKVLALALLVIGITAALTGLWPASIDRATLTL